MGKRRKKSPNFILRKNEGDLTAGPTRIEREIQGLIRHLSSSNRFGRVYSLDTPIVSVVNDFKLQTTRLRVEVAGARIDGHEVNAYAFIDRNCQIRAKVCHDSSQRKTFLEAFARETR